MRQGDPISPKLFTSVPEAVFRKIKWKEKWGIPINGRRLTNIRFADDIVLFATSAKILREMLTEVNHQSMQVGLNMNTSKTKLMTNNEPKSISIGGTIMEYVQEYKYLGQIISFSNRGKEEINHRITAAWSKFWSLNYILLNKKNKFSYKEESHGYLHFANVNIRITNLVNDSKPKDDAN